MSLTYNQKKLLGLALHLYKLKKKKRRFWVQPYLQQRTQTGQGTFYNLLAEMRLSDIDSFVEFFRVTPKQFENLLGLLGGKITAADGAFREPISARDRLAVTLRFLASGDTMKSICCVFRISCSSIAKIVEPVCRALGETLGPVVLPPLNASTWGKVASQMSSSFQFPNCVGAIGGRFVKQTLMQDSNNEKIVFLAVCDPELRFIALDVSVHARNGLSFESTSFGKALADGLLDLPPPVRLAGTAAEKKVPCAFAGDYRFPLKPNLMKPYQDKARDFDKDVFDYRLSRCRNSVDNALGVMSTRFRVLSKPVNAMTSKVRSVAVAAACLHNYLMADESPDDLPKYYCPDGYCDHEAPDGTLREGAWRSSEVTGMVDMFPFEDAADESAESAALRDTLKTYFCEPAGAVPFQREKLTTFDWT